MNPELTEYRNKRKRVHVSWDANVLRNQTRHDKRSSSHTVEVSYFTYAHLTLTECTGLPHAAAST